MVFHNNVFKFVKAFLCTFINIKMGNNNVKKNKSTTSEPPIPKPPEGMPNPMEFDLQDIETPDDVFIQRQTRYKTYYFLT